jgi:hypothetical protein
MRQKSNSTPGSSETLVRNIRRRLHGGLSPGAPRGPKNGNYKTKRNAAPRAVSARVCVCLRRPKRLIRRSLLLSRLGLVRRT